MVFGRLKRCSFVLIRPHLNSAIQLYIVAFRLG